MICKNCNSEVPVGNQFCTTCGTKVEQQSNNTANKAELKQAPLQPQQQPHLPQQKAYVQPQVQNQMPADLSPTIGVGTYLIMFIVSWIPVIGFIMAIVWAVQGGNKSKRNFALSMLILMFIGLIIAAITYFVSTLLLKTFLEDAATNKGLIDSILKNK